MRDICLSQPPAAHQVAEDLVEAEQLMSHVRQSLRPKASVVVQAGYRACGLASSPVRLGVDSVVPIDIYG